MVLLNNPRLTWKSQHFFDNTHWILHQNAILRICTHIALNLKPFWHMSHKSWLLRPECRHIHVHCVRIFNILLSKKLPIEIAAFTCRICAPNDWIWVYLVKYKHKCDIDLDMVWRERLWEFPSENKPVANKSKTCQIGQLLLRSSWLIWDVFDSRHPFHFYLGSSLLCLCVVWCVFCCCLSTCLFVYMRFGK